MGPIGLAVVLAAAMVLLPHAALAQPARPAAPAKAKADLKKSAKAKQTVEQRCARQAAQKGLQGRQRALYISACMKR